MQLSEPLPDKTIRLKEVASQAKRVRCLNHQVARTIKLFHPSSYEGTVELDGRKKAIEPPCSTTCMVVTSPSHAEG